MYKYLLTALIIAIFTACSAPKPDSEPSWYTTIPKDFNFFYATGSDIDVSKAKKKAIASLRMQINTELNNAFKNKTTKLKIDTNQKIDAILMANEYLANTLSMRLVILDKTAAYKNDHLVLIKLSRKSVFDSVNRTTTRKLNTSKEKFQAVKDKIAIKKFIILSELMVDYPKLVSKVQAKKVALASYDTYDEFNYLNDLMSSYRKLKEDITVYVLSDMNSRAFTPIIKDALKNTGLILSTKLESKDALKLFVTSKTTNEKSYSFNQSKSLVKFTSYDVNKKQVSFKQHTFIGKSRKNYKEAKQQSAISIKSKVAKMGIFDFLGLK